MIMFDLIIDAGCESIAYLGYYSQNTHFQRNVLNVGYIWFVISSESLWIKSYYTARNLKTYDVCFFFSQVFFFIVYGEFWFFLRLG